MHQVDEQVRNLKMIKDALEGKGNPKERRQLIIKKLGDVHHGEDNFKAYLKGITDRLAVVGELLNKESFVFKSGEKADIKTRLGLTSRSHISSTDDKLKNHIEKKFLWQKVAKLTANIYKQVYFYYWQNF